MDYQPEFWIGIDPSINHTGWGIVQRHEGNNRHVNSGVIIPKSKGNSRYFEIASTLSTIIRSNININWNSPKALVEIPTFEESGRGRDCARKQGLTKLCMVTGIILCTLYNVGATTAFITARQWKRDKEGKDIPKSLIKQRVEEVFNKTNWEREDEWEALGIICWGISKGTDLEYYL